MNDSIPNLKIELMNDNDENLILLEQDSGGHIARLAIHSIHVRYIAEKMGLIPSSDLGAAKTIATMQRRIVALRDRIENLADWMAKYSDHKHADLSHETTQLDAMAELAREWCYDFEEAEQATHPSSLSTTDSKNPPACSRAPSAQVALL